MARVHANRIKESTSTTGTGDFTLTGAAANFRSFADVGNTNTCYYAAINDTDDEWEVGLGTYSTTGPTLARTTVLSNHLGTTATVSFTTAPVIHADYPGERAIMGVFGADNEFAVFDANGEIVGEDAATARATMNVDVAGTDNSTDVTLSGTGTYISIAGQVITVDPITESDISDLGSYITASSSDTLTNKTLDGDNNTVSNLDIGNEVDWALAADVSDRTAFASGDKMLIFEAGVGLRKIDYDDLPSGSGIANVVEDTTPQLGGDLDANAFDIQFDDATGIRDDSDNEQLIFQKTASAVNHIEITNAATAGSPTIAAVGDDTNIDLTLSAKGTGDVVISGGATDEILTLTGVASAVNYVDITNAATGNDVIISAAGDDANVDIDISPKGTGNVLLGNYTLDGDQTVGAGQDNYILTYDDGTGLISLEAAAGGGNVSNTGTPLDSQIAVWTSATIIEGTADFTFDGADLLFYNAVNDGNPEIRLGAADAEELHIQTVYDGAAQTLDYVLFQTEAASAVADKGEYRFNVDGTVRAEINDSGVNVPTGNTYRINDTDVLSNDTLGSGVVTSSLTTVGALNSGSITSGFGSIDIGASTLSATGTITGPSGTWDAGGMDLATTDTYAIAGTDVLTSTVLGSGVVTSSLTTVGALASGSIAAGFGNIDNGTSNITTGGIARIDVDGTAINAAGSLNFGATATDSAIYFNGTNLEIDSSTATEISVSGTTVATFDTGGLDIASGDTYAIGGTDVLSATTLGTAVVNSSLTSVGTLSSGNVDAAVSAASTTTAGKIEIATVAEIDTGDALRAMSPDQFQASFRNLRFIDIVLVAADTACATGTDIFEWEAPFAGTIVQDDSNTAWFSAWSATAGATSGTMVVDVHLAGTTIMTTNKLDIEVNETSTRTAATQPDLTTTTFTAGQLFTFDIDAVHTTPANGLVVRLALRPD